ncbi:hypothetical protein IGS59_04180 [Janthinobacterium sp. GW460P]|uniref:hypothetical protein n=1 Tax=unclassified Janthinobacterium TaxID=2610881 RepID=UPI000A321071|nr:MULTISPECIES: hypothetical protein [unclassified Janthinobacterium]MCC7701426.1 hypothetical protein [Janthinobacterium sp. GW460P]MCC7706933.1 hypothetical protein [Janthinobacterium sp. GW460W]
MKLTLLCLPTFLFTACASIDNAAEAAKVEAAGWTYRQCLVGRILSKHTDVDLYCRPARIGLFQAVMADPRHYEKSPFFDAFAKNIIEMARHDVELAKDVVSVKPTR